MSENMIWLSYDLGVTGDYEGMYAWLDDQGAKECNSSLAFFQYFYEDDLLESLKQEIRNAININNRSRIYVIFREGGKTKGRYLIGKRKNAPWTGFGSHDDLEQDESPS